MINEGNQHSGKCQGVTRRSFLADTGMGFTGLALGAMLFKDGEAQADTLGHGPSYAGKGAIGARSGPHFIPNAKSVIWIFLFGGVSHLASFDVKPALNK